VELPNILSVVGCEDLQEGGRHSEGWIWKGCKLVELLGVVGNKGKWSMERAAKWLMVKLALS